MRPTAAPKRVRTMTYRCNPFLRNVAAFGGFWMPRWLVTPRRHVGPVATAFQSVHRVHPPSMGGGRRKLLILFRKLPSVHPSTPSGTFLIRAHVCTGARVCAHAHGRSLPTHRWTGWTDGRIEYSCGFASSTLRPPCVQSFNFLGAKHEPTAQPVSSQG
jgi:hypothetical protein